MSEQKVALGRTLFFDTDLSATGQYSCASCHDPARAFTDGRTRALGATGQLHARNTPTLVNAAYAASLGWLEGGARTLEVQHRIPLLNDSPVEMGFPGGRDLEVIVDALASYVRTLIYADSAFDRYLYYGEDALDADAKAGLLLYLSPRTGCSDCHLGFNLSGPLVHALAPDAQPTFHDGVRAPTLRNVAVSAPYMHDGSITSLPEVIDFYAAGGRGAPIELAADERSALVAFLVSLTDRRWDIGDRK